MNELLKEKVSKSVQKEEILNKLDTAKNSKNSKETLQQVS